MRIGFLGGDARMRVCAEGLLRARHTVLSLSPFGVGVCLSSAQALTDGAEAVVLPSPATRDGVHIAGTDIPFSSLSFRAEQRVFGGFLPSAWKKDGVPLLDLSHSESFQLKNAALTAEGAIATALSASGRGFYGLSLAVVGYGRIGRLLAARLSGFGVPITVYARRKETRTEAALAGYKTHPLGEDTVFSESVLFNTVPEHVFARARARGALFAYDLGGGFPAELTLTDGGTLPTVSMRGVPGVFAPSAAGEIILEELLTLIER